MENDNARILATSANFQRMEKVEMKYFNPKETANFLKQRKTISILPFSYLAIETGMRPEEYLGLQWKDIDFKKKVLSVRRALVVEKAADIFSLNTKQKKAVEAYRYQIRSIKDLKPHRRKQLEERIKLGENYENYLI